MIQVLLVHVSSKCIQQRFWPDVDMWRRMPPLWWVECRRTGKECEDRGCRRWCLCQLPRINICHSGSNTILLLCEQYPALYLALGKGHVESGVHFPETLHTTRKICCTGNSWNGNPMSKSETSKEQRNTWRGDVYNRMADYDTSQSFSIGKMLWKSI